MKKSNFLLGVVSTVLVSSFVFGGSNNIINPNLNNNHYLKDGTHVSTYDQLKSAFYSTKDVTIILDNDISLSNFTPGDVITNNKSASTSNQDIIIDGNGYGFVDKPSQYYNVSIFDDLIISYAKTTTITFRNLTLDNVGSFIGSIFYLSTMDYDSLFSDPSEANLIGKGLTFQNITIENNIRENKTYYLEPYKSKYDSSHVYQPLSFLANTITLYHYSSSTSDEALTFSNILVKNNHIDNNNFYIVNDSSSSLKPIILDSFITNLEYIASSKTTYTHHSFVTYEYVYIRENSFTNNVFKIGHYSNSVFIFDNFDSSIQESFGNLSGNSNGTKTPAGSNGNYLYIHDIYVGNNIINESKKINADSDLITGHYNYSELISNSNSDPYTQYISTIVFENIFIFNNESYYLDNTGKYQLTDQKDLTILNINLLDKNNKPTSWETLNSKNLYIYGPMYNSLNQIKIFKDTSLTSDNDINYGRYLFDGDYAYYKLVNILVDKFGIYGYQIDFNPIEIDGEIKNAVSSISIVNEDHIDIVHDNLIYSEDNSSISQIELSFKYYQDFEQSGIVEVPYKIDDLKLYNDIDGDKNFEPSELIAISNQTYSIQNDIYNITLDLINEIEFNQDFVDNLDLNNLYLGFDYWNSSYQKVSSSTILKIDPNQLETNFPGFPEITAQSSSKGWIIIGSVAAIVLFILLIVLSILLVIWILKRKNNKKNTYENEYYNYENNNLEYDYQNYDNYDYDYYNQQNSYDYDYYNQQNSYDYDNYELNNYYQDEDNNY